jgi:hypothetical protein
MKFRPLHDRVVVKRVEEEGKTKGGIIIPDTAKEKPMEGEVVAVGPGFALVVVDPLLPPHPAANDARSTTTSTAAGFQSLDIAAPLPVPPMGEAYPRRGTTVLAASTMAARRQTSNMAVQTLKRMFRTSPSWTSYALASSACLP